MSGREKRKKKISRHPGLVSGSKKKSMNEKSLDIQIERVNKAFHLVMDVKLALQSSNMPVQELAASAAWALTKLENQLRDIKKG